MSITVTAVCQAVSAAFDIVHNILYTEHFHYIVSQGKGEGFWDYYSYSNIAFVAIPRTNIGRYIDERLFPRLIARAEVIPDEEIETQKNTLIEQVGDYRDFECWNGGGNLQANINVMSYNQEKGKFLFQLVTLKKAEIFNNKVVNVTHMHCEIRFELAKDWAIWATGTIGWISSECHTEIEYFPAEITPDRVADAIVIAFAPIFLGLVPVPTGFMDSVFSAARAELAKNPEEYGYTEETAKDFENKINEVQNRVNGGSDSVTEQAKSEFGTPKTLNKEDQGFN